MNGYPRHVDVMLALAAQRRSETKQRGEETKPEAAQ